MSILSRIMPILPMPALLALTVAGCDQRPRIPYEPVPAPAPAMGAGHDAELPREVRGVWITNVDSDVLLSKDRIAEMMEFLAETNINVVFPVVWNKALTMYPSDVMEETFGVRIDPLYEGRDPLAEIIAEAHRHGIEVMPWFEYGFAASHNLDGGPIIEAKPHWAAIDQDGNLVTKNGFEWMNAFDPEVQEFLTSLVLEVAENYDVDGIQGDDRMPALPTLAGYDEATVERYREEFGTDPPADIKDPEWVQWRADILSDWLEDLYERVKEVDPNLIVSSSPSPYDWSLYEYLQDSYTWTNRGIVDIIHPQAYRYGVEPYQALMDDIVDNQFTEEQLPMLSPGVLIKVGSYRIPTEELLAKIGYNREKGVPGEVFFFYEGLREENDELARALRRGPYAEPALVNYRENMPWRPGALDIAVEAEAVPEGWEPLEGQQGFYSLAGGQDTPLSWQFDVPRYGHYDVYAWLPEHATATEASYLLTNGHSRTAALVDQSDEFNRGWVHLGTQEFNPGNERNEVVLRPLERDVNRQTVAGPLMLLLNRRHSPNVVWN